MPSSTDHIVFIAPTAYPLGGVSVWLDYLLRGLQELTPAKISFAAVAGKYHDVDAYTAVYPFASVVPIYATNGTRYSRVMAVAKTLEQLQPTMVVCVNIPDAYLATRVLRHKHKGKNQYSLVATLHALEAKYFVDMQQYRDVIDHVVATNKLTQSMMRQMTEIDHSRLHYAPYGIELPNISRQDENNGPLRILYCGRIDTSQKRCQDIPKIVNRLRKLDVAHELYLAGDGPYKQTLLSELQQTKVIDFGTIAPAEIYSIYQQVDVLLLTSEWETGPIVVWEAMANGVAVISSNYHGRIAEAALEHNENCLIFEIEDCKAAAQHLETVSKGTKREELVRRAHRLVSQRYSREVSLRTWRNVFGQIFDQSLKSEERETATVKFPKQGQLDRLLGHKFADLVRRLLPIKTPINSAGDEWTHSHASPSPQYYREFERNIKRGELENTDG
ncbi:MAG: glycosyltransferase family 4 protein [Acidiferrobacterales bacterium]|nr:glycosyltransferase family 4 protein [Acidiferrobacterales bacterium]